MNANLLLALIAHFVFYSCSSPQKEELQAIQQTMEDQESAWNNGDLRGFMNGYWMSDSLIFSGGKSITYGWEPALKRYQTSYGDKAKMGKLSFASVRTKFVGDESALTVGEWTLHRSSDTLSGRFTLLWQKINGAWVIIADHSS